MFSVTMNRHKLKWKFYRGLTRKIHVNKITLQKKTCDTISGFIVQSLHKDALNSYCSGLSCNRMIYI